MVYEKVCLHLFFIVVLLCTLRKCWSNGVYKNAVATMSVNVAEGSGRKIPDTLFGIFFEEINHAGSGGLWAELVSNRGFEAGGPSTPSVINPWSVIGNESFLILSTDRSSCFKHNKVALRMEVLCHREGANACPMGGVGVYNPGFWGMNIKNGEIYKLVLYVKATGPINITVSLTASDGLHDLAATNIIATAFEVANWKKIDVLLEAEGSFPNSRLQFTTHGKIVLWFDQVSLMPLNTYKGHGFRTDLVEMLIDLKPKFMRFPGGCFVEGEWLRNAFRWKETVGSWENRPGHFGDVWMYWTDDGLGYFELLQLAEDLGALPVWVVNNGIGHQDEVDTSLILPFVQEALDSIEFARGDPKSKWGSVRTSMGHPQPFNLKYIALGNEDCGKKNYIDNYLRFYNAIKLEYPDIKIISNCDASSIPLNHPADLYDFHVYTSASDLFLKTHQFDWARRNGPKVFVSEYAVTGKDSGTGSLLAGLAEAGFLIGLEKNSDVVEMASYAPLFVNTNDRRWNPDAIVFNSSHHYGTPSYWVQQLFAESSGGVSLEIALDTGSLTSVASSAIMFNTSLDSSRYIRIKVVNIGGVVVNMSVVLNGLGEYRINPRGSTMVLLTSSHPMDENSFEQPKKVIPVVTPFVEAGQTMEVKILPFSFILLDLLMEKNHGFVKMDGDLASFSTKMLIGL